MAARWFFRFLYVDAWMLMCVSLWREYHGNLSSATNLIAWSAAIFAMALCNKPKEAPDAR